MDLISRETAKNYIDSQKGRPFIGCTIGEAMKIMLDEVPSAEPEKRVKVELNDGWFCCCGCDYCTEHYSDDWKYCPMCGARLEWE